MDKAAHALFVGPLIQKIGIRITIIKPGKFVAFYANHATSQQASMKQFFCRNGVKRWRISINAISATLAGMLYTMPAEACHHYTYWAFHFAQKCRIIIHQVKSPEDRSYYVEIVLTPQVMDEISHGVGIDKIKQLNQKETP